MKVQWKLIGENLYTVSNFYLCNCKVLEVQNLSYLKWPTYFFLTHNNTLSSFSNFLPIIESLFQGPGFILEKRKKLFCTWSTTLFSKPYDQLYVFKFLTGLQGTADRFRKGKIPLIASFFVMEHSSYLCDLIRDVNSLDFWVPFFKSIILNNF